MEHEDPTTEAHRSDVLILGAGFSRAISELMPLTDELGQLCLAVDGLGKDPRIPLAGFHGGAFEVWLSHLADEQPYLNSQENLENQALFLRFSSAIATVLGRRVQDVLHNGWPDWLPEFLRVAHVRQATLISFNYDPLVECGVGTGLLDDWGSPEPVDWTEVIGNVPSWAPGALRLGATPARTLRLLKLHGSLNWYWTPADLTGVSIARRMLPGVFGAPEPYTEDDRRRELPGRVPFVVPPSATKSPYYRNPIIREIWRQAAAALRKADRIVIVGYSLPPGDLTFSGLLVQALGASDKPVLVVDPDANSVADRLRMLGIAGGRIETIDELAPQPVERFVCQWRDEMGEALVCVLNESASESIDDPMLLVWSRDSVAAIVDLHQTGAVVEVGIEAVTALDRAIQSRGAQETQSALPSLRRILQANPAPRLLRVRLPNGGRQALLDHSVGRFDVGYGRGVWNIFTPSGPLPQL